MDYDYSGLGVEFVCPVCGKHFVRLTEEWAYKTGGKGLSRKWFCSWKCLNDYREQKTGKRMGKATDKTKVYEDMRKREKERKKRKNADKRNSDSGDSDLHRIDDQGEKGTEGSGEE